MESDTPSKKALETGTIGRVCVASRGLRRIRPFGDNCSLEYVVYDDVGEAELPKCTQGEQCLRARSENLIDVQSDGECA